MSKYGKASTAILGLFMFIQMGVAEIDFRSDEPIDFYNDVNLKNDNNINLSNSEIQSFFDQACPDGQAIKNIKENGSFTCADAAGNTGLPKVLGNDNTADQNIKMNANQLKNLGKPVDSNDALRKQDVSGEYVNRSGDKMDGNLNMNVNDIENPKSIELLREGTGARPWIDFKNDSSEDLDMRIQLNTGSTDELVVENQNFNNVMRFRETGNVRIPNGGLNLGGKLDVNGEIEMSNNNIDNVDRIRGNDYVDIRPNDDSHGIVLREYDGSGTNWAGIRTDGSGQMQLRADGSSYDQLELLDSGEVEIGNGELDMTGNSINSVGGLDASSGTMRVPVGTDAY
jgi:hypothetical protein